MLRVVTSYNILKQKKILHKKLMFAYNPKQADEN